MSKLKGNENIFFLKETYKLVDIKQNKKEKKLYTANINC